MWYGQLRQIGLRCGEHEIQYTEWIIHTYTLNYIYIITCLFVYASCELKIYWQWQKNSTNIVIHILGCDVAIFRIFLQNELSMSNVSINKQPTCFQIGSVFYLGFARARIKRLFSHLKCLRNQHVAHELPVDAAWPTFTMTCFIKRVGDGRGN